MRRAGGSFELPWVREKHLTRNLTRVKESVVTTDAPVSPWSSHCCRTPHREALYPALFVTIHPRSDVCRGDAGNACLAVSSGES